jgi:hypothetical protein
MRTFLRVAFAAGLFLLATGFTECEYFMEVTVPPPAADTDAPLPFGGVWQLGEYKAIELSDNEVDYEAIPGEDIYLVGGATDYGGVARVSMSTTWSYSCCGPTICSQSSSHGAPNVRTQAGQVGSVVKNGLYTYAAVRVPSCTGNDIVRGHFGYTWQVTVEDFSGNRQVGPLNRASWRIAR